MGTNDLVVPGQVEVTAVASPVMSPRATAMRLSKFIPTAFLSSSSRMLLSSASSSDGESKLTESTNSSSSGDEGCSNNDWEEDFFLSSPTTMRKGLQQMNGTATYKDVGQLQIDALSCLLDDEDNGNDQNQ